MEFKFKIKLKIGVYIYLKKILYKLAQPPPPPPNPDIIHINSNVPVYETFSRICLNFQPKISVFKQKQSKIQILKKTDKFFSFSHMYTVQ